MVKMQLAAIAMDFAHSTVLRGPAPNKGPLFKGNPCLRSGHNVQGANIGIAEVHEYGAGRGAGPKGPETGPQAGGGIVKSVALLDDQRKGSLLTNPNRETPYELNFIWTEKKKKKKPVIGFLSGGSGSLCLSTATV